MLIFLPYKKISRYSAIKKNIFIQSFSVPINSCPISILSFKRKYVRSVSKISKVLKKNLKNNQNENNLYINDLKKIEINKINSSHDENSLNYKNIYKNENNVNVNKKKKRLKEPFTNIIDKINFKNFPMALNQIRTLKRFVKNYGPQEAPSLNNRLKYLVKNRDYFPADLFHGTKSLYVPSDNHTFTKKDFENLLPPNNDIFFRIETVRTNDENQNNVVGYILFFKNLINLRKFVRLILDNNRHPSINGIELLFVPLKIKEQ